MKIWRCTVCGWLHEGEAPPEHCPRCGAPAEMFELVDPTEYADLTEEEAEVPAAAEVRELTEEDKKRIDPVLFKISYGLYIVGSVRDGRVNAQACNTVFQITGAPVRVAVGINKNNLTNEYIKSSGVLSVCILGRDGLDMVRNFGYRSGRNVDKFEKINYVKGKLGTPIIKDCIAYIECRVAPEMTVEVGTHTLFIAEVTDGNMVRDEEPMTYAYFREAKQGGSRKNH